MRRGQPTCSKKNCDNQGQKEFDNCNHDILFLENLYSRFYKSGFIANGEFK